MTMTFLQRYRAVLFVSALITAVAALFIIGSDGVRAPLLTMLGGVMLLAALFPNDISQWSGIGAFAGTIVITIGSWFWLMSVSADPEYSTALGLLAVLHLVATSAYFLLMLFNIYNQSSE